MRTVLIGLVAACLAPMALAQTPVAEPGPAQVPLDQAQPGAQVPPTPAVPEQAVPSTGTAVAPGGPVIPAPVIPPVPLGARTFTATTGVIFAAVRPDRVVDFEMVIGYLEAALETSTDPTVRAQADGWRVLKATEPGPNGTVLYAFVIDPTVPGADYGLGRILSDAYPDQIQDIWKLYTGALAGGGSLLNLTPVEPAPLLAAPDTDPTPPVTLRPPPPAP